ncbi:9051_t:CDS:1, partial [Racocetra persica]
IQSSGFSQNENEETSKCYYEILGISKEAKTEEINRAYRKLALQYHPDKNKSSQAEKKFQEITKAYDVLSDEKKRGNYDMGGVDFLELAEGIRKQSRELQKE